MEAHLINSIMMCKVLPQWKDDLFLVLKIKLGIIIVSVGW